MADADYPWFCDEAMARRRAKEGLGIFGVSPHGRNALRSVSRPYVARFMAELGPPAAFALFIAWPRSGHSLLGALLDAHPDMAFAHELHACKWFSEGFTRNEIFYFCWQNARHYRRTGRVWGGYDYTVPDQWQGRVRSLRVLGDKKGGETSLILSRHPKNLLNIRRVLVSVPLMLVH